MNIDFYYFEDCPSHNEALERLRKVLAEHSIDTPISIHRVETEEEAQRIGFPGSPTIRIDGRDIDPEAQDQPVGLTCRVYRTPDGRFSPLPPEELIQKALHSDG